MKKILMSLLTIAMVSALITGGTMAYFSDEEEVGQNVFTAGTLELEISSNPTPIPFTITNMKPGDTERLTLKLKNVGSIDGVIKVGFSAITNYENGRNGPEIDAGDTYGPLDGELGWRLMVTAFTMRTPSSPGVTSLLPWYKTRETFLTVKGMRLDNMGGTTHWLKENPSSPNIPAGSDILGPGEEASFAITVELPSGVGNIVQSDSVSFDLIFTLDQVTP